MGVYWIVVNHKTKEWVNPWGEVKMPGVLSSMAGRLAERWWGDDAVYLSDCEVSEGVCEDDEARAEYLDVTQDFKNGTYNIREHDDDDD